MFIVPIKHEGNFTILFNVLLKYVNSLIAHILPLTGLILTITSVFGTIIVKTFQPKFIIDISLFKDVFDISLVWLSARIAGMAIAIMVYWKKGPDMVISESTGGLLLNNLIPSCILVLFLSGFLLPLLLDYGLMDFFGVLTTKQSRKLFCLSGYSAATCFASWFCSATTTVLIADRQYSSGIYTARESCIVMTCFAMPSIAFTLIITEQLEMESLFFPFYLSICLMGIISAFIVVRIPPLSMEKDDYYKGIDKKPPEEIGKNFTKLQWAYKMALQKASDGFDIKILLYKGIENAVKSLLGVIPAMIGIGSIAVIISEYTPLFRWVGIPFIPLLRLMKIPEASEVAGILMSGFADNYIPIILGKKIAVGPLVRLVIGITSLNGIIFMSGTGSVMMQSKTTINLWKLFVIFIERTLIGIIISPLFAKIILLLL
jgi:nucleoside recognition membrane protein YjiH